jgi:hypothetical protein
MSDLSTENLYPVLLDKAMIIVNGMVGTSDFRDMAHDITVDFLFFSKSFAVTFDERVGGIEAFFGSYVRKKCLNLRHNRTVALNRFVPLHYAIGVLSREASLDERREVVQAMKKIAKYLSKSYYVSPSGVVKICLRDVYVANLHCNALYGRTIRTWIAKRVGFRYNHVKIALEMMCRLLKDRSYVKSQDSA